MAKIQAILNENLRWCHLRHEPLEKVLRFLSSERHALRSSVLPHESDNPNTVAYELAQARGKGNPWNGRGLVTASAAQARLEAAPQRTSWLSLRRFHRRQLRRE